MSTSVADKAAQRKEDGSRTVELPQGVTANVKGRELLMKGPNGSATKVFQRIPVDVEVKGNQVKIKPFTGKKKDVISANTVSSIVRALVHGVTKGYEYKMKVVFAHFPVTVKIKDDTVVVENFMGERSPRTAKILAGCKVTTEGDDIIIKGNLAGANRTDGGERGAGHEDKAEGPAHLPRRSLRLREEEELKLTMATTKQGTKADSARKELLELTRAQEERIGESAEVRPP